VPGDQMLIEMRLVRLKHSIAKMRGVATVDGHVVAEATLMCKLTDRLAGQTPAPKAEPEKAETPVP